MNTYLIPVYPIKTKDNYTDYYISVVYADSEYQAYEAALNKSHSLMNPFQYILPEYTNDTFYETFYDELPFDIDFFHISQKNVILKEIFMKRGETYMELIDIYNYMIWGNYNTQIQSLADKAIKEPWSFEGKNDNYILKNYLSNTFNQLQREDKIIETDSYCLFNTGLFTDNYIPIYAYGELNRNQSTDDNTKKWYFKGFKDEYELASIDVDVDFPERADYFKDTTLLVFDWHCEIHTNYDHILKDLGTYNRLPDCVKNSDRPLDALKGYIDTAIQKVTANYKLAIPHYYQEKIQLMIPLYFSKSNEPDVALILEKRKGNHYQAKICLTMEMAYMDARLIAKPESDWLKADSIVDDNNVTEN